MSATSTQTLADIVSVQPRFGRSVHLERDLAAGTATDGYFLTTSAVEALQGVLRAHATPTDRALSLIGPYGAGKSAFATFLARLVSEPGFAQAAQLPADLPAVPRLLPVPIVGSRTAIGPALLAALRHTLSTAPGAPTIPGALTKAEAKPSPRAIANAYVAAAQAVAAAGQHTGLLLLVDEAGKFLEYAATHPQAGDIFVLQELAEAAARAPQEAALWVLTVLHQNAEAYAHRLGRTQQGEWAKVAQRFRQLPLFPSDVERMDLIGRALRHGPELHLNGTLTSQLAPVLDPQARMLPSGLEARFPDLARAAYPLHPLALLVVPALFRRAGQSHRSIFSFLEGQENGALGRFLVEQPYDPASPAFFTLDGLFDYSRDVLLAHYTGPSARPWLEAVELVESDLAVNPPLSPLAARVLKCIALLNWLREQRLPASDAVLTAALGPEAAEAIEELVGRSLIVWSRARHSYRLWEGGDVDVEAELTTARATLAGDVLLSAATDPALFPLPRLIARRHAFRTGTLRPVSVEVLRPEALMARASQNPAELAVLLCLAPNAAAEAQALADVQRLAQPNLLIAVALETEALREAAHDLAAARLVLDTVPAMLGDRAARRELALRRHEADTIFRAEWARLFGPALGAEGRAAAATAATTATWYRAGREVELPNARAFSQALSDLADNTFHSTPVLRNELLNRRQLSSAGAAARGALVKAMLNHGEQARLGFTGFPPEYAMYASVLQATGLHHELPDGTWEWRSPLTTPTDHAELGPVWQAIERLVYSSPRPVPLPDLYEHLRAAPYGVSEGVLPVLLAIFRRVHQGDTSLYREGNFLAEEKDADWELLLRRPDMFALGDSRVQGARLAVVERIAEATGVAPQLVPVVRRLLKMQAGLPEYTRQTGRLEPAALELRDAFQQARSPENLLFYAAPVALGLPPWPADAPADAPHIELFFTRLNAALQVWNAAYPAVREEGRDLLLKACAYPAGAEGWAQLHHYLRSLVGAPQLPPILVPLAGRCTSSSPDDDLDRVLALVANRPPQLWRDVDLAAFPSHAAPLGNALQTLAASVAPPPPAARPATKTQRKQVDHFVTQLGELLPAPATRPPVHLLRAAVLRWLDALEQEEQAQ
ncbi:hypothetical protein KLP40_16680 [Hymenobacter sp. NST-14]|uniref:hypothetical protein n=1 Tax=Hymenobacter piscis TaxID=2839984 RepID=UPI001C02070D|nr:hypothetical protein [Hymenobacter piscis]MBT9394804.1 hypothetical protein [Hymenobacter piscis]